MAMTQRTYLPETAGLWTTGLLVVAVAIAAVNAAAEDGWPASPGTAADAPAPSAATIDLRTPRHVEPALVALEAAATAATAVDKPLTAVLWDAVLARQVRSKTAQGPSFSSVREGDGTLEIDGVLGHMPVVRHGRDTPLDAPFSLNLTLPAAERQAVLQARDDRALSLALTATVTRVRHGGGTDNVILLVDTRDAAIMARRNGRPLTGAVPVTLRPGLPAPVFSNSDDDGEGLAEETGAPAPAQVVEGEDFDSIRVFADWELGEPGWYGRVLGQAHTDLPYSGGAVAVAHPRARGQALTI
jgi:hypothetical protein